VIIFSPLVVNGEDIVILEPIPRMGIPPFSHVEVTFDSLVVFEGDEITVKVKAFDVASDVKSIIIPFHTSEEDLEFAISTIDNFLQYPKSKKSIILSHESDPPFETSEKFSFIFADEDNWILALVSRETGYSGIITEPTKIFTVHPITEKPDGLDLEKLASYITIIGTPIGIAIALILAFRKKIREKVSDNFSIQKGPSIIKKPIPLVEKRDGKIIPLEKGLSVSDSFLQIIYSSDKPVPKDYLYEYFGVYHKADKVDPPKILEGLVKDRLIVGDRKTGYSITEKGKKYIQDKFIDKI